ncbi:hypothetical protein NHQ30_008369 [Ciborinia camelliae]|nr:hypothetical protein NHQ30_008369 [Ciborinia camelliae]
MVGTEYIREIASTTVDNSRYVRDSEVSLQNTISVVSNMDRMGITTPEHRKGPLEIEARQSLAAGGHKVKVNDFDRFKRLWSDEWSELQKQVQEGALKKFLDEEEQDGDQVKKGRKPYNQEFSRWIFLNSKKQLINKQGVLMDGLINDYNKINSFHGELLKRNPDTEEAQISRDELRGMIEAYDGKVRKLPLAAQLLYAGRLDAARVTTEFEKRKVEPLKVYAKEFAPSSEMCLLDIQPQALWPILRQDYPKNYDVFEYILSTMFSNPANSVHESLEGLWPGVLEYVVNECPSLTDPSKGGVFDLKYLSVRAMTLEMLKEIVEAWMRWPFRPSRFELMTKSGSMVYDPDSAEEDVLEGP